jgi:hypothetical protein
VQAEDAHAIWNPFYLRLFYGAGEAPNRLGDMSLSNLRQDWGVGVAFAIQNEAFKRVLFRFKVGFGSGEGVRYSPRVA